MPKLVLFDVPDNTERPEDRNGLWATPCPGCAQRAFQTPGCGTCKIWDTPGWVFVNPVQLREACKIQDHEWKIEFDAGSFRIECVDPHPVQVQEAMYRHQGHIPGCLEDGELHDMIAGALRVKVDIVVEGGSYEYPNDYDVWFEIKEAELDQ